MWRNEIIFNFDLGGSRNVNSQANSSFKICGYDMSYVKSKIRSSRCEILVKARWEHNLRIIYLVLKYFAVCVNALDTLFMWHIYILSCVRITWPLSETYLSSRN